MNMTDKEISQLLDLIQDMIKDSINSNRLTDAPQKPVKIIGADVISVSGDDITVLLAGESTTNITIRNLTGQTISANDKVEVVIKNGNYTNAFVGWKHP